MKFETKLVEIGFYTLIAFAISTVSVFIYCIYKADTEYAKARDKRRNTVVCEVLREDKAPLECNSCLQLDGDYKDYIHVRTMTGYKMRVHKSRVRWQGQAASDRELLKPYRGDK